MENISLIMNNGDFSDIFTKDEKGKFLEEQDNEVRKITNKINMTDSSPSTNKD